MNDTDLDNRLNKAWEDHDFDLVKTASEKYPWCAKGFNKRGRHFEFCGDAAFVLGSLKFDRIINDDY